MRSFRARLRLFAERIAALLFAAMFAAFLVQVFARYILNNPDRVDAGIRPDPLYLDRVLVRRLPAAGARPHHLRHGIRCLAAGCPARLAIVLTAIVAIAFLVALPKTIDYITFMKIERSPILRIRFDLLYSIFAVFHGGGDRRRGHPHQAAHEPIMGRRA